MIYQIKNTYTGTIYGTAEGADPIEAIATWLVSRGIPATDTALIARNVLGLEVIPAQVAALVRHARVLDSCALGGEAGAVYGLAFAIAEHAAR